MELDTYSLAGSRILDNLTVTKLNVAPPRLKSNGPVVEKRSRGFSDGNDIGALPAFRVPSCPREKPHNRDVKKIRDVVRIEAYLDQGTKEIHTVLP